MCGKGKCGKGKNEREYNFYTRNICTHSRNDFAISLVQNARKNAL